MLELRPFKEIRYQTLLLLERCPFLSDGAVRVGLRIFGDHIRSNDEKAIISFATLGRELNRSAKTIQRALREGGGAAPVDYLIEREVVAYDDNRNALRDSHGNVLMFEREPLPEVLYGDAIETAGEFSLPWIKNKGGSFARPVNIASKTPYNGVNIVSLWVSGQANEFPSNVWGTYRQWQSEGCQVRKGEKSSLVVFYKTINFEEQNEQTGELENGERMFARASWVFNAAQVEGFEAVKENLPEEPAFDLIARAEAFAAATKAIIEEGGDRACYIPSRDIIRMPDPRRFTGTQTSSPAEAYYSTLCHELVHWSGSKTRLKRDLANRFGSEAYAMEELIAELGAAFLCGDLGITQEPREDHACYIKNWLTVLKNDKKAIFTAASKASQASNYLIDYECEV